MQDDARPKHSSAPASNGLRPPPTLIIAFGLTSLLYLRGAATFVPSAIIFFFLPSDTASAYPIFKFKMDE